MTPVRWIASILLILAASACSPPASAEDCDCDQYRQFLPQQTLASQVAATSVWSASTQGSHPFYQTEESRAAYRAALRVEPRIPEVCKTRLLNRIGLDFYLSAVWDPGKSVASIDGNTNPLLLSSYHALRSSNKGLAEALKIDAFLTPDQKQAVLAFQDAASSPTRAGFLSTLEKYRGLSAAQRINILGMYMSQLHGQYDPKVDTDSDKGIDSRADPEQLYAAFHNNVGIGARAPRGASSWSYSGVCRQHALAGAQAAEALGFSHAIVISYQNISNNGHATFAFSVPGTRQIAMFNWGYMTTVNGKEGSEALFQQMGDAGAVYRYSRASDGKTIAVELSQFQQFLAQVTGFDPANSGNPLSTPASTLIGPSFTYHLNSLALETRAFYGQDRVGATYYGASQTAQGTFFTPMLPFKAGVTAFAQERPKDVYASDTYATYYAKHLDGIYAQLELRFLSPELKIPAAMLRARIEAMATGLLTMSIPRDGHWQGKLFTDGDINTRAGLRVVQGEEAKSRFLASYYAGVSVFPIDGQGNVSVQGTKYGPVLNDVIFTAEGRAKLCRTGNLADPGCAYVFAHAMVLADYFGLRGRGEAGIAVDQWFASLGVQGRLNKDMPAYRDGTNRRVFGTVRTLAKPAQGGPSLEIGIEGSSTLEKDTPPDRRLQGTIRISTP